MGQTKKRRKSSTFKQITIATIHLFIYKEKQEAGRKLAARLKAHNACQEQDKANQDIKKAMDQEIVEWVQTREVIINEVKKATKPLLSKLQSFETKMQKTWRVDAKPKRPRPLQLAKESKQNQSKP